MIKRKKIVPAVMALCSMILQTGLPATAEICTAVNDFNYINSSGESIWVRAGEQFDMNDLIAGNSNSGNSNSGSENSGSSGSTTGGSENENSGSSSGSSENQSSTNEKEYQSNEPQSYAGPYGGSHVTTSQVTSSQTSQIVSATATVEEKKTAVAEGKKEVIQKSQQTKPAVCLNSMAYESYYKSLSQTNLYDSPVPSHTVGDPVFISNGAYYLENEDDSFRYGISEFKVKRNFVSGVRDVGAFGVSWQSSLDTRIIRGRSVSTEQYYDVLVKAIAQNEKERADYISYSHGSPSASDMNMFYNIDKMYKEAKSEIEAERNESVKAEEYNKYSMTEPYDYMNEVGVDYIMYIDENGGTNLMKYNTKNEKFFLLNCSRDYTLLYAKYIDGSSENGFEVHEPNGTVKKFNKYGRPVSYVDRCGNAIEFTYSTNSSRITDVRHKSKIMMQFVWKDGYVTEVKNAQTNTKKTFVYDNEELISITDSTGAKQQFAYDKDGDLLKIVKPDLSYISVSYGKVGSDKSKRTIQTSNEERWSEYFDYGKNEDVIIYTDPSGNQKKITFKDGNPVKEENSDGSFENRVYDSYGRITSVTDNYGTRKYSYGYYDEVDSISYEDGTMEEFCLGYTFCLPVQFTDRDGVLTEYSQDRYGNITKVVRGGETVYSATFNSWGGLETWSGLGGYGECTYDSNYNLISDSKVTYAYDSYGNVKSKTDYKEDKTTYKYSNGNRTVVSESSNGLYVRSEEDSRGNEVKVVQRDERTGLTYVKECKYNRCNQLVRVKVGQGDSEAAAVANEVVVENYAYNAAGNLAWMIKWNVGAARENDADGVGYYYIWENGRIAKVACCFVNEDGVICSREQSTSYQYDFIDGFLRITEIDGNGNRKEHYTDRDGKVVKTVDECGRVKTNTFSGTGNLIGETNVYGGTYEYTYDPVTGKVSSSSDGNGLSVVKTYDKYGNLKTETGVDGSTVNYSYAMNEKSLTVEKTSDTAKETSVYDLEGNLTVHLVDDLYGNNLIDQRNVYSDSGRSSVYKFNGRKMNRSFDAWGRQTYDSEKGEYYTYDFMGRLASVKSADGKNEQRFEYNAFGHLSRKTVVGGNVTNYFYNSQGNLSRETDLYGTAWEGAYDAAGNLVQEKGRLLPKTNYSYDPSGLLEEIYVGEELVEHRIYSDDLRTVEYVDGKGNVRTECLDEYGRIVSVTDRLGNTKTYTYDDAANMQTVVDFNGKSISYSYDKPLQQLNVTYESGRQDSFGFDAVGDIIRVTTGDSQGTSRNQQLYTYGSDRQLSSAVSRNLADDGTSISNENEVSYSYDSEGRIAQMSFGKESYAYTYDAAGRLSKLTSDFYSSEFFYDDFGREIKRKNSDGTSVLREYDSLDRLTLLIQQDSSGKTVFGEGTVYGDDGRIAYTVDDSGKFNHYVYDSQGRVSSVYYAYDSDYEEKDVEQLKSYGLNVSKASYDFISLPSKYRDFMGDCLAKMGVSESLMKSSQKCWTQKFEYDENSNCVAKITAAGKIEYEYDEENRLVKIAGKYPETFTYDANGNLLSKSHGATTAAYQYSEDNKLVSATVTDTEANTVSQRNFTYDALGRMLVEEDGNGNSIAYAYNGMENQLLATYALNKSFSIKSSMVSGEEGRGVRYVNPGAYSSHRNAETSEAGTEAGVGTSTGLFSGSAAGTAYLNNADDSIFTGTRCFAYANGNLCFQENDTEIYSVCVDAKQSVRSIVSSYSGNSFLGLYDVNGNVQFRSGNSQSGTMSSDEVTAYTASKMKSLGLEMSFCGKLYDSTLNLYNYGQRFYSPSQYGFIAQDPAQDGLNWYSYCGADSVNYVDAGGLRISKPVIQKKMQQYGEDTKLGRSWNTYVKDEGCYLTLVTDVVNSLAVHDAKLETLNSMKRYFVDSEVRTDLLCKDYKLDHKEINCRKMTDRQKWKIIDEYKYSNNEYAMGIKLTLDLEYGTKKVEHFIGTDGHIIRKGDTDFIRVVGTSLNDRPGISGRETWWKDSSGNMYMPLSEVEELRVFSRTGCLE